MLALTGASPVKVAPFAGDDIQTVAMYDAPAGALARHELVADAGIALDTGTTIAVMRGTAATRNRARARGRFI
jgi:fermentation-respiration switch protein FrsA (DUF1100 family)